MVKFSLFLLFFFSSIYSQQLSSTVSSNKIGITESLIFTIKITDIDYIVPHQANERIIDALAKKFNLPHDKIIKTVNIHANTSASSIPLAVDWGLREQKIINGSMLALNAIGGGLSWGASIIKFGKPDIDL